MLEINSSPMVRFLDSDYSIDTLIKWLTSRGIVISRDFYKFANEVKSWMSELKPQAEPVPNAGAGSEKKTRLKGDADRLRTAHFIEWVGRTKFEGKQGNYYLQAELRLDKPELWGKNQETFNKWLQTDEAMPAKELLDRLKLEARIAV